MSELPQPAGLVRFGVFEVNLDGQELRKQGMRVRLQRQPFEILTLLLERQGAVVTREELRDRLWPDGTFVDFEHSLNAAVKRLRMALGDSADTPRFVETVHRRGYRFVTPVERMSGADRASATPESRRSERIRLAVLPFTNLTADPDQDYFSAGLTEEMIARLGRIHPERLGVIARTSAQRFKDDGRSIDEIGRELHVRYVVEGSVRANRNRMRISVQLVDARDQTHLWSETFERPVEDFLGVQSDVAERVARSLAPELLPGWTDGDPVPVPNVEANSAYLKGRFHWAKWGLSGTPAALESAQLAIRYYDAAIEHDPSFARAHAALARAHAWLVEYSERPARETLEYARALADRAVELDPTIAWAYLARASARMWLDWDWAGAEADHLRAVELEPNCEAGHRGYAEFLSAMNRADEAIVEADRATELDPLCLVVNSSDACVRYMAGHYDAALAACRHVLELDQDFALARRLLGVVYLSTDQPQDAIRELRRAVEIEGRQPVPLAWLGHALAATGRHDEAVDVVEELNRMSTTRYVSPYRVALVHTALGDHDAAFDALDVACDDHAAGLLHVAAEPRLAPLRSDPRYRTLVRRIGLESGPRLVVASS